MIQGANDVLLCKDFLATFRKTARAWYVGLHPKSISSFEQLESLFVANFSTSQRMPRTSDSLFFIKQNEGETLRNFVAHFNAAILEVKNLNEDMAILAMKRGLRGS